MIVMDLFIFSSYTGKRGEGQDSVFIFLLFILYCSMIIDARSWPMLLEAFVLTLGFEPGLRSHITNCSQVPLVEKDPCRACFWSSQ